MSLIALLIPPPGFRVRWLLKIVIMNKNTINGQRVDLSNPDHIAYLKAMQKAKDSESNKEPIEIKEWEEIVIERHISVKCYCGETNYKSWTDIDCQPDHMVCWSCDREYALNIEGNQAVAI